MSATRTIKVPYLARVEGEGAMQVKIRDGKVSDVKLTIFEPPRFFEAFLQGRKYSEAPDITARICGICPAAYQMSSVHAMEDAFGITVDGQLRELRRLLYCGEWIESHVLHMFFLHAPDFLGYESAIEMARDHGDVVQMALRLKKLGNDIMNVVGGREIHPINVRVGGFYRLPTRQELAPLRQELEWGRDAAVKSVEFTGTLTFPELERDYEFVALRHPDEYPLNEGRLVSNRGLDIAISEFLDHFEEQHAPHSHALHARIKARGSYFVGPLARYNLNFDRLTPLAQETARRAGLGETVNNPFRSIIVRGVETLYACEEAIRIIDAYRAPDEPFVPVEPRKSVGHGCSEAPRGILYHRYELDEKGDIRTARIIPPTSQNQKTIEEDLREFVERHLELPHDRLQWECEQAVRNYDPCISCATHFLKLTVERE